MSEQARPAIPDVIIGGAPRSGTTFLCELLAKHPGVFVAQPFSPEPKVLLMPYPDGDAGVWHRYENFFADAPWGSVRVEKTSHLFENDAGRERLARLLPDVRLIFILREPVARAYSNWRRSRSNGLETLSFADAIAAEGRRPNPFDPDREYVRPFDYMIRSQYARFAERWIASIGRERIAFFMFEEAIAQPDRFVLRLQDFLRVEQLPWAALATGIINANDGCTLGVDAQLRAKLREAIGGEMRRLGDLTGLDVSRWGY